MLFVTGVAHELVGSHDVYRDFFIPKGTLILPLEWYVHVGTMRSTQVSALII